MANLGNTVIDGNLTITGSNVVFNSERSYAFHQWNSIGLAVSTSTSIEHSLTIETTGRPVFVFCSGDNNPTSETAWVQVTIYRDGTKINYQIAESHGSSWNIPFSLTYLDAVPAGSHTYRVVINCGGGSSNLCENELEGPKFGVFEI